MKRNGGKGLLNRASLLPLLCAMAALIPEKSPASTPEDFFKWGEYDSLIRVLEPTLTAPRAPSLASDSSALAKSYVMMGVALFATGRNESAERHFRRACRLQPGVRMETYFVSPEIADRFEAIAAEEKWIGSYTPDTLGVRPVASPAASGAQAAAPSRRNWIWWTAGSAAALAVGGGLFWILAEDGPDKQPVLVDAR